MCRIIKTSEMLLSSRHVWNWEEMQVRAAVDGCTEKKMY